MQARGSGGRARRVQIQRQARLITALAVLHTFAGYVALATVALLVFGRLRPIEPVGLEEDADTEHWAVSLGSLLGVLVVVLAFVGGALDLLIKATQ